MSFSTDAAIDAVNESKEEIIQPKSAAVERIAAALKDGKFTKGFRGPDHGKKIGGVLRIARQHIELMAGDVLEACNQCKTKTEIVESQTKGCSAVSPETLVVIYADDAFHIVEQAGN